MSTPMNIWYILTILMKLTKLLKDDVANAELCIIPVKIFYLFEFVIYDTN